MDEQQNTETKNKSQAGPMVAIIGLIVIVVVGVLAYQAMDKPATNTQNTTVVTEKQPETEVMQKASTYKDGEYTAVGTYRSPGGEEELGVTLTIANGIVTDSQIEVKATRPISKTRQEDFAEHYKELVVGKNIDALELGKVSGSSLSPKGFTDAVEKIKAEAKA